MPLLASPAVCKALDVLDHLAAQPGRSFSVAELARELELPRATCHTVLLALADRGYVRRDPELRYALGPSCIVLGDAAQQVEPAQRAAAEHAEALARAIDAFVVVSIRDGGDTLVTRTFDHGPALSLRARVGEAIPLIPPFGASLVAWDEPEDIEGWLARAEPPLDRNEAQRYREALAGIRARGYSVTLVTPRQPELIDALHLQVEHRQREDARRVRDEAARQLAHSEYLATDVGETATIRIAQVSAPVFGADRRVAATIMVLGPTHEVSAAEVSALGRQVAAAAAAATADASGRRH